jgi:predicted nucleotide-binding protein
MSNNSVHYDIFVSYAKEDSDFAQNLVDALKAKNISVWYDQGELRLGDSILRRIEDGLENSNYFLLLLSPEYFKKPWTQFERGVALGRGGKGRILPVFLKHCNQKELVRSAPSIAGSRGIEADKHSLDEIAAMISDTIKNRNDGERGKQKTGSVARE